jgi:hypothetical protein
VVWSRRFGSASIFVSTGIFASRHIRNTLASYLGFPAHKFSTFSFCTLYSLPLFILFPPYFIVHFFSHCYYYSCFACYLSPFFLSYSISSTWFLGVCFFLLGFHAWVVFVLYLTSYMAGFGFWVGGDDCWCASFCLIDISFFYSFPFTFPCIYTTTLTKKRRGG